MTLRQKARVANLVAALRSGEYKQGFDQLKSENGKEIRYCCLGVACDLYGRAKKLPKRGWNGFFFGEELLELPPSVQMWYGFKGANPSLTNTLAMAGANDVRSLLGTPQWTFERIATQIEKRYLKR